MTYFTFDTAWIVATMQNGQNEIIKARIRERLDNMNCDQAPGYGGWEGFETFCWAWQNDCLQSTRGLRRVPVVNCYPYKPDRLSQLGYDMVVLDESFDCTLN